MNAVQRVGVDLGKRSYPILIGSGLLDSIGSILRENGLKSSAAFIVADGNTVGLFAQRAADSLATAGFHKVITHAIPAGEDGKSWDIFSRCCDALLAEFPDTGQVPVVIALGGGVVGDLAGFAAATFRRGVPYVQAPTTLLSAVDSSVGGKTGINHRDVKNIMGAVYQPRLVVTDLDLLGTLPAREVRSGMAEVIKYGAICRRPLFEELENSVESLLALEPEPLARVVADCCRIKADVVRQDESDTGGVRIVLNFGHTVGHALEMAAEGGFTHGEAISVGMVAATRIARALDTVGSDFEERLVSLLQRAGLPTSAPGVGVERVVELMRCDKKFRDGKNRFVLPTALGEWIAREGVDEEIVLRAVESVTQG